MTIIAQQSYWVLVDSTGALQAVVYGDPPQVERYPNAARAIAVSRAGDPQTETWGGSAWVEDPAKVEALLIAPIKAEAERRKMLVRSPGAGKGAEYRQKRAEGLASANIAAALLNALTAPAALAQYPAAATEAAITGEKLGVVLARYLARSTASDNEAFRLAAIEQASVAAIRAASTGAAKRAAAAKTDWNWKP